jgi:hypothetical protein
MPKLIKTSNPEIATGPEKAKTNPSLEFLFERNGALTPPPLNS